MDVQEFELGLAQQYDRPLEPQQPPQDAGHRWSSTWVEPVAAEQTDGNGSLASPTIRRGRGGKRNKPTLSCGACVDRKTKCDRRRPSCLSCVRRQCTCQYNELAELLAITGTSRSRKSRLSIAPRNPSVEPVGNNRHTMVALQSPPQTSISDISSIIPDGSLPPAISPHMTYLSTTFYDHGQTATAPPDRPALFNYFGMSSKHPFHNYWTEMGGLTEVIAGLPPEEEADELIERYFEVIDPIYPIVNRVMFMAEYRRFWRTPIDERQLCDSAHLALQFAMFASAMQHIESRPHDVRESTSEFYLSCCHQSLCISSYLDQCSLATMQTMILICNFLIASHRVNESWTFSGIAQRQAYGLGLNMSPGVKTPTAPFWEQQIRCRLWLATMFQDTSLSLWLALPPATIHHDIDPSCLKLSNDPGEVESQSWDDSTENAANDISYLRAIWQFAQFMQENMCINRALRRPIAKDAAHKADLVNCFRRLYLSFDPPFNSYKSSRFEEPPPRLSRQIITLSSNYFFTMTVLCVAEDESTGVGCDVYGALDAAHEGLSAFFALSRLSPAQMDAWGVAQTRAYTQATLLAKVLVAHTTQADEILVSRDPRLMLAKSNLDRYVDVLARSHGSTEFDSLKRQRLADLRALRASIRVI